MNPPPDTEGQNPPLDTEDLKALQEAESQTTKTSSAMNVTSKDTTRVIAQSFRGKSPKRSLARKRRKVSWTLPRSKLFKRCQFLRQKRRSEAF